MKDKFEKVIQIQKEMIAGLEERISCDQALIDAQERKIQVQQENISLLEKEKATLTKTWNELLAANEKLEEICMEQQELLKNFVDLYEDMKSTQS